MSLASFAARSLAAASLTLTLLSTGSADELARPSNLTVPVIVRQAQRIQPGTAAERVTLPHTLRAGTAPSATFRFSADLGGRPAALGLLLPEVLGQVQLRVNGHPLSDVPALGGPLSLSPGPGAIWLWPLPDDYLRPGRNDFEVQLSGNRGLRMPEARLGPAATLAAQRERLVLASYTGPALVAAVIGCLGVCVLLLFFRRRSESLYGYFGLGALLWSLHSLWTVLAPPLLPQPHYAVWWNAVFMLYVAMLVIFCLRFTEGLSLRLERALWILALTGPLVLYAAVPFNRLGQVAAGWRLMWIAIVLCALAVVAGHAWHRRSKESLLLLLTGFVGAAFGVHDWVRTMSTQESTWVQLTPYAGLFFIVLVAWVLMDRFVRTTEALESMNRELELRVSRKSEQLVQALEAMREAKDAAEAANRAKSSFLASASHDLRQPIHALGLYMTALQGGPLEPSQADLVERMHGSVSALDAMFNALLDISRMDAGALTPQPRALALAPLLHRLGEDFGPLAADKGLRLSVRISNRADELRGLTDPLLLERVLRNLLSNAIKYTAAGGVLLSARVRDAGVRPRWRIEVWDTGVGIPPDEQERVFEEFYQVGNPERDRAIGLGLGLSIVRRVCQLLHHAVSLSSVPARGTRFTVWVTATGGAAAEEPPIPAVDGSLVSTTVAVIEDDPEVRAAMSELLGRWGCMVLAGCDVRELIQRYGQPAIGNVQAVVADFRLRESATGVQAVEELASIMGFEVPALIVSGDSDANRVAEMQASGHDWLPKPVPAARLRSWLVQAVLQAHPEVSG